MNVDYLDQIYFGIHVSVYTWVKKLGNTSLQLYEEIWQGERLCAKGTVTYVNFDLRKQKPERIPDAIRKDLEKHYYKGQK